MVAFDRAEFDRLSHHVAAALEHNAGTQTIENVMDRLSVGAFKMWTTDNAIVIGEICKMPSKTLLNIALGGGDLDQVKLLVDQVEQEAHSLNIDGVSIIGRRGWGRSLAGYKEAATVYMKEF